MSVTGATDCEDERGRERSREPRRALGGLRLGVRTKLIVASVLLVLVAVVVGDAYVSRALDVQLTEQAKDNLYVRAELVARESEPMSARAFADDLATRRSWDALADDLGRAARTRVSLIRRDGVVLGDSEVAFDDLAAVENHAGRPEVVAALGPAGRGDATRTSVTVRERLLYVAVPLRDPAHDGAVVGVARVAEQLNAIDEAMARARRVLLAASALALALAMVLALVATERLTRVVREVTDAARRMSAGDLEVRTRVVGNDEVAELGRALDQLAASLSTTLAELRDERDMHGRILEGMQEGVVVLDREDRVVLLNPAVRAMLLLAGDVRGRPLLEVVRWAELDQVLRSARAGGKVALAEIDLPGLKPRRLLVHAAPLRGGSGGLLAVLVDVTDLRRLESLRRDFVANVSHELRTPVTAVRTAAETLRESALDDRTAALRFVDMIDRNAQRLQSLIDDLLELSRLESKEFKLKRAPVDVGGVVGIVVGLFRERAEKKGVRLTSRPPATLLSVETDARALEQVLTNLVDNAVKYCPAGATVTLEVDRDGDQVRFVVADTGPGIANEHLERVFERFYRVDAGRSRELGGTGLGLSIVKHLVEAMGGRVKAESTVAKGTTFTVALPSR